MYKRQSYILQFVLRPIVVMAQQEQHPRAQAFHLVAVLEAGEPDGDLTNHYMVRMTAPDGLPVILSLEMATTVDQLNTRLNAEFGAGAVAIVLRGGAPIGPGWRPLDIDEWEMEMVLEVREE